MSLPENSEDKTITSGVHAQGALVTTRMSQYLSQGEERRIWKGLEIGALLCCPIILHGSIIRPLYQHTPEMELEETGCDME